MSHATSCFPDRWPRGLPVAVQTAGRPSAALWEADRVLGEDGQVEGLWRQQSIWSQTANRMKASIGHARSAALALTMGGAVVATLAARFAG
jgi:hypothetical protein